MPISDSLEIDDVVQQIIALERDRLDTLIARKTEVNLQNTSYTTVDSSIESLQKTLDTLKLAGTFTSSLATSGDSSVISASAGTNAVQTVYQMEVVRLAQAAKITSASALGLSQGTYAVLQSSEEINLDGGSAVVDPNVKFSSGSAAIGFDADKTVVSGTFKINDTEIAVTGSDTIYTILSKINASAAGVTATFDAENDKVLLTSDATGTDQTITLSDDTSGLLDALKLTETNGNPPQDFTDGTTPGLNSNLVDTDLVSGSAKVVDGYFTINNITIEIDVDNDTLAEVLSRINTSQAGVSAFYDDVTDRVTISSKKTGEEITFENDTSNFLKNINVLDQSGDTNSATGKSTYAGTTAEVVVNGETLTRDGNTFSLGGTTFTLKTVGSANVAVEQDTAKARNAVKGFVDQFNNTMSVIDTQLKGSLKGNRMLQNLKRSIQRRIYTQIENTGGLSRLGEIGVKFIDTGLGIGSLQFVQSDFNAAMAANNLDVYKLFADDLDNDGTSDDGGFALLAEEYLENFTKSTSGIFA
ncbi:flagellar filament capping protein FliD, partial [bacterium]|nr:flagellar filament capping protein FliD [bacterium]